VKFVGLFVLVLGAMYLLSEQKPPQIIAAGNIYVVDGDTIDIDGARFRLTGFDTPETYRAKCDAERARGDAATERLRALIATAQAITFEENGARDKYGRGLGQLYVDDRDVGRVLISEGLARVYTRGQRQNWCEG
jgi:endonuclease YncB( thermonuclease family)